MFITRSGWQIRKDNNYCKDSHFGLHKFFVNPPSTSPGNYKPRGGGKGDGGFIIVKGSIFVQCFALENDSCFKI